jgi:hypothetical protein
VNGLVHSWINELLEWLLQKPALSGKLAVCRRLMSSSLGWVSKMVFTGCPIAASAMHLDFRTMG